MKESYSEELDDLVNNTTPKGIEKINEILQTKFYRDKFVKMVKAVLLTTPVHLRAPLLNKIVSKLGQKNTR